jgi:circadian clock protein KaiC
MPAANDGETTLGTTAPHPALTASLPKAPTGIPGFDEVTDGGLPRGRTTLVVGGPGCGKTLFGMSFLIAGIRQFDEPGVFVAFEETAAELEENVRSLGYELESLIAGKKLALDHVRVERSEIEETGDYDLEGLFVRLGHAIDSVGAKRVVIDTLEVLFAGLTDHAILRAELRRLFRWLNERGVTAIVTAERGPGAGITRHGLEEYVSDCVVLLDHRVDQQVSTRRLRVVKYRGSRHGANEYPFLIDECGLAVFPITSMGLDHAVSSERVATGIQELDEALDGRGYMRGSSVLVTGTPGTGKTTLAAAFVDAACGRGERALYFSMEESPEQIVRNMHTVGIDLDRWRKRNLLSIRSARPTLHGLETHLATVHREVEVFGPDVVVVDPITNFGAVGSAFEVTAAITRILDFLKSKQITALFTALTSENDRWAETGVSSWMDTWMLLRMLESGGSRRRGLLVIKSRGMPHSDSIHELRFTARGIRLGPAPSERT